jgi:hypothetical protein
MTGEEAQARQDTDCQILVTDPTDQSARVAPLLFWAAMVDERGEAAGPALMQFARQMGGRGAGLEPP